MALAAVGRICTVYSDHVPDQDADAADQLEPHVAAAVVDVFVYVVVLNLFVEYLPQVISETFTHPVPAHGRPAERRSESR